MKQSGLIYIFVFFFLKNNLVAQDESWKQRIYLETNYNYGFLMPHSEFITYFVKEHIQGFQLNIGIATKGDKNWHQSYNFPKIGIGYHHSGLGNSEIYGTLDAVYGYVERYYLPGNKRFNFGNRLYFGGAYVSKHFDLKHNSTNMAIGSSLNAYVNYSLVSVLRILPRTEFKIGAGITHVSNGNFKQPNKGLNFISAFSGFTYKFGNQEYTPKKIKLPVDTFNHQFQLFAIYGRKQLSRRYDLNYTVTGFSTEYSHEIIGNSWGGVAFSFYYDPSLRKQVELSDSTILGVSGSIRLALNLVYELKMGRISYVFQPGVYIKNPYKEDGIISNRIAVRYQINDCWMAGLTIKAHWFAIADFFEWGIGYRWKK